MSTANSAYVTPGYVCDRCGMHTCECPEGKLIHPPAQDDSRPTNPRNTSRPRKGSENASSGISGTRIVDAGWEDADSIEARSLPSFPVERLGSLGPFVTAGAEALQVPVDLLAFACLATISTATGGRAQVQIKPGWIESLALYLAALADSSEKKTPALNLAARPLREAETELIELARPEIEKEAQEIRITQGLMAKAEQKVASDKPGNARADAEAARVRLLELGETPELPRLLIRDATLEAIGKVMHGQRGRIGLLASEGGLLKVAAGLYSGSSGKTNTDLLLEAFSGGPYTVDRTGRPSAHMPWTFMAIGLIVQPGVLAGVEKKNPEFRENGLLGRFLYCRPAPTESDTFSAPDMPQEIYDDYDRKIQALVTDLWTQTAPATMTLSDKARELFAAFYDKFAPRRKAGGDLYDIADWAGKLRGQLVRIAACITLFENPASREISGPRMEDAIAMAPYFIAHGRAVFDLMGRDSEGRLKPARDLLAWLRVRKDPAAPFAARDAWQALKGRRWAESMEVMTEALDDLEEYGWIALQPQVETPGKRGRKPSPRYDVHPWVAEPQERPHDSAH